MATDSEKREALRSLIERVQDDSGHLGRPAPAPFEGSFDPQNPDLDLLIDLIKYSDARYYLGVKEN